MEWKLLGMAVVVEAGFICMGGGTCVRVAKSFNRCLPFKGGSGFLGMGFGQVTFFYSEISIYSSFFLAV